jgi:Restriction endonuclease
MDLDAALGQFDRVEANLARLQAVLDQLTTLVPDGIEFGASPEARQYRELCASFSDIAAALPPIDSFRITARPLERDTIAQSRLDANEIGEPEILINLNRELDAPQSEIDEYRRRFSTARRRLVRSRLGQLIEEVDDLLALRGQPPDDLEDLRSWADAFAWEDLQQRVAEIRRLLKGGAIGGRMGDLMRHLSFAEPIDLRDIVMFDWPSVRPLFERQLYSEQEPLPVTNQDLAQLAATNPAGPVTTALEWSALDDERFERLIFNLISDAAGYENPQWLTRTRAPDRGRDLSVDRISSDSLGGTRRARVMIQCKHWASRSVGPSDAADAMVKAQLWTALPFDVVVIATTGRFSSDAVAWIENHNLTNRLQVEMWPESHLEMLLVTRPAIVEEFGLRPTPS